MVPIEGEATPPWEAVVHTPAARVLAVMFVACLCSLQVYAFREVRQDDAFITYRYAQNLVEGSGLVFNSGDRFLGATSPAHILLSALAYFVCGRDAMPSVMAALGCVAWSAQAVAAYALLAPALGRAGAAAVALLLAVGGAQSFKWVSLETNIVAACVLAVLVAVKRGRDVLAAILMALACLVRPDALLLAALLLALCISHQPRRALRPATLFVLFLLPWLGFAFAYYGSPVPHSAVEKFHRTTLPRYFEHAVLHVSDALLPLRSSLWMAALAWMFVAGSVLVIARRARDVTVFAAYALVHLLAYLYLRPFAGHDWHLYPTVLAAVLYAAAGLAWVARFAPSRLGRTFAALILVAWIVNASVSTATASHDYVQSHWVGSRDQTYHQVAEYLATHARAGEQFASIEVGTLAYYSQLSAYDLGGLITDLRHDMMSDHPVRFLVLDTMYITKAPPWPPVFTASVRDFKAFVYNLPDMTKPP